MAAFFTDPNEGVDSMLKDMELFDVNGYFGHRANAETGFATAAELLAQMDRLGISRTLVYNAAAMGNPMYGNLKLLEYIKGTPGADGRLIPSFIITPGIYYCDEAVDCLKKLMGEGVRALRFFRGRTNNPISQLKPLIKEIMEYNPVLFIMAAEFPDYSDVIRFADEFPSLPIVCTQAMWGNYPAVFDMMYHCRNILMETSYVHTSGTIEMVVKKFGANRILFGTDSRYHDGASIASLVYAELSEEDRESIAHMNMDNLLGIKTRAKHVSPCDGTHYRNSRLWRNFLEKKPIGLEIIDAHVHLDPSAIFPGGQISLAIKMMDEAGVKRMIISNPQALHADPVEGNKNLAEKLKPYYDRFSGYFVFNPRYAEKLSSMLDEAFSNEFFVGFKILCDYWYIPVTSPDFTPMWRYANSHRLPILIHTWDGDFGNGYDNPAMLQNIVKEYPDAIFIIAHSGGGTTGRREAEKLAIENDNVYLEWCGSFTSKIPFDETFSRVGKDKIIFGTDAVGHSVSWELGRLLSLNIPEEQLIPVLGHNMKHVLSLRK